MDLHPSVLAWISSLPPEEQRDYMVRLQLAFSAEAPNSTPPTASMDSLPLTAVEPPATPLEENSLPEESREWAPPDEDELAAYRHQSLEPQAEPEHSQPHSISIPERTEEFISTAEISPRDEPSEPEEAITEDPSASARTRGINSSCSSDSARACQPTGANDTRPPASAPATQPR